MGQRKLRIIIINTRHFYGGGDSIYGFNLAELLRNKGHEVAFFAMKDSKNLPDPNADLFVSHIDYQELNQKKSVSSCARVLSRSIYSREARKKFSRMLDRFRPDLVHLQNIHAHITPSVVLEARRQGVPVVWTLHDYKIICPNSHFLNDNTGEVCEACGKANYLPAITQRCKKGSLLASVMAVIEAYGHKLIGVHNYIDHYLTPSAFLKGKVVEGGIREERVTHMPLFLKDEMFNGGGADRGYLLFLGKLDRLKGIHTLLKAAHLTPEVPLLLAGAIAEPLARQLETMLPANVRYLGMKSREEVKRLLTESRALVLPSICYENQPLSILEAFAAGKPVIASDLGGMTELVKDGERGLLVPPGNVEALAAAMRWMANNQVLAREMGKKAQQYAMRTHSPDKHYEKLKKIYDDILTRINCRSGA